MPHSRLETTPSGLLVPKPKPPRRNLGPLEIEDGYRRAKAANALDLLWEAMRLGRNSLITGQEKQEAHRRAYEHLGRMILGEDLPKREEET